MWKAAPVQVECSDRMGEEGGESTSSSPIGSSLTPLERFGRVVALLGVGSGWQLHFKSQTNFLVVSRGMTRCRLCFFFPPSSPSSLSICDDQAGRHCPKGVGLARLLLWRSEPPVTGEQPGYSQLHSLCNCLTFPSYQALVALFSRPFPRHHSTEPVLLASGDWWSQRALVQHSSAQPHPLPYPRHCKVGRINSQVSIEVA